MGMSVFEKKFREETPEFGGDCFFYLIQRDYVTELYLHRRDGAVGNATRYNSAKRGKVGVYVKRKTMIGGPSFDRYANGGDFSRAKPDAGLSGPPIRYKTESAHRVDQYLFEQAQISMEVFALAEIYD